MITGNFNGTVMQIEKALPINENSRVSKVS